MDPRLAGYVADRWHPLIRYAAVVSGDPAEAQEVARAVLVRVATRSPLRRNRDDLDDPGQLDRDVRIAVIRSLISRWRRQRIALDEPPAPEVAMYAGPAGDEGSVTVLDTLRRLPPRQRAMLALRFLNERSEAQTAAVLGCTPETVRTQTLQALAILRRHFPDLRYPDLRYPDLLDPNHDLSRGSRP